MRSGREFGSALFGDHVGGVPAGPVRVFLAGELSCSPWAAAARRSAAATSLTEPMAVRRRRAHAAYWRVTFDNGPVNLFDVESIEQLGRLVTRIEEAPELGVVFDSANPDFFVGNIQPAASCEGEDIKSS